MKKTLYACKPGVNFAQEVVTFVHERVSGLALTDAQIWVPSPRIAVSLKEAFTQAYGGAALLPDIRALSVHNSDLDIRSFEEKVSHNILSPLSRLMVLTELVQHKSPQISYAAALMQAQLLENLFNKFVNYDISLQDIQNLLPPELASHWQKNIDFLEIVLQAYPHYLSETGMQDQALLMRQVLVKMAENLPERPLIVAAGFNDTTPSGLIMLKAIQKHRNGAVILSGYTGEESPSPTHHQYRLNQLISALNSEKSNIKLIGKSKGVPPLCYAVADDSEQEAQVIALMMREAIEDPEKTCALVSGDRTLALRVSAALKRWNLDVDDSAGSPLTTSTIGQWVSLLIQLVHHQSPENIASFYKHPWMTHPLFEMVDAVLLRGPLMGSTVWENLDARGLGDEEKSQCVHFLKEMEDLLSPFKSGQEKPLPEYIRLLYQVVQKFLPENFTASEEAFMTLLNTWQAASTEKVNFTTFSGALITFMKNTPVRRKFGGHPRLFIWGAMEARLQQVDRVIIGGANEGGWPRTPTPDPWLSPAVSEKLGLPSYADFVGLTAHDFMMLTHACEVMITRALKQGGSETIPSRFLLRRDDLDVIENRGRIWVERARKMMTSQPYSVKRPHVKISEKPTQWSASFVGKLMQCPYQVFVEKVFKAEEIKGYSEDLNAADKGNIIHKCLEALLADVPGVPGPYCGDFKDTTAVEKMLLDIGEVLFGRIHQAGRKAIWWQKYQKIAMAFAREMAQMNRPVWQVEASGKMSLSAGVTLKARADRLDLSDDGSAIVMDYKTGSVPTQASVINGESPQLPIEALLAFSGGYGEKKDVSAMEYWEVRGEETGDVVVRPVRVDMADVLHRTSDGLNHLAWTVMQDHFVFEATPGSLHSVKGPCTRCRYAGLCRFEQWETNDDG